MEDIYASRVEKAIFNWYYGGENAAPEPIFNALHDGFQNEMQVLVPIETPEAMLQMIELIDIAIEQSQRIAYDYNKIGIDKKLHKSSYQVVSPYQLILHNQRYYLMAYSEYWGNMVFHRLDRITNMKLKEEKATDLQTIPGYKNGIDYKKLSSAMPYMFSDEPERIDFVADAGIVDQIVDWFGNDISCSTSGEWIEVED